MGRKGEGNVRDRKEQRGGRRKRQESARGRET